MRIDVVYDGRDPAARSAGRMRREEFARAPYAMPLSDRAQALRDRDAAHSPGRALPCLASRPDDGPAASRARQRTLKEWRLCVRLTKLRPRAPLASMPRK